ncbi:MAG: hypothetical protein ACFWTJ_03270 [Lachnoclostridium sp.]|jgi:hypothetical protein
MNKIIAGNKAVIKMPVKLSGKFQEKYASFRIKIMTGMNSRGNKNPVNIFIFMTGGG